MLTHNDLRITEREVVLARLPAQLDGFRVVQISDLHFYEYTDPAYYEQVVQRVNALDADVIALTGDTVHYGETHIQTAASYLSRIRAKEAQLGIVGNHDYQDGDNGQRIGTMLTQCGFRFLKNAHYRVERNGARLWFAGVDDLWYGAPDIHRALEGVAAEREPVVVLSHNPLMFDPLALGLPGKIDLVLAGHTHAGHVHIPFLRPIYQQVFRMKYRYGLFEKNGCQLHVTSGVGSAAFYLRKWRIGFPRFRFNTYPEIAVLTLRCA